MKAQTVTVKPKNHKSQKRQREKTNHTAQKSIEKPDAIIYETKSAYLKTDECNKNQRQAAAISMLYAYTCMVTRSAFAVRFGRNPRTGYLRDTNNIDKKDVHDKRNRLMIPILAPISPCFEPSKTCSSGKRMRKSGHGRICISKGGVPT